MSCMACAEAGSAAWQALDSAKAQQAAAATAISEAMAVLHAASAEAQPAAAEALKAARAAGLQVAAATKVIIESDGLAGAIIRAHTKLIEYHGKAGYDSLGYGPKLGVQDAISSGALLNPGTRDLVLHLAEHRPSPSVAKADKVGWEAVDRYIYAFYDTAKFTKFAVPDATSFKGCQGHHRFIGLCTDRRQAEVEGPLRAVKGFCACDPCLRLRTEDCLLPQLVGKAVRAKAPLRKGAPVRVPQLLSLEKYADSLDATQLVAINVDDSELEEEGSYWLALLTGAAFVVEEDMMHSGQQYREGWLVVPGKWYKLRQRSERGYELQPQEVLLVVNHMVFLKDLTFTSSQCGRMLKVPALAVAQLASSEDASRLLSAMLLPCWNG